jgi:hypothetical protein
MQFDVLRELFGPKVTEVAESDIGTVRDSWEEVLVVNVDGAQYPRAYAGPTGSFERALQAIEADEGLETGKIGEGEMAWGYWRGCFGGVCLFGQAG